MIGKNKTQTEASEARESQTTTKADLKKLKRLELLELLYDQARENEQLSTKAAELTQLTEHLKDRLNGKDEQIERLKGRLDDKDALIAKLQEENDHYKRALDVLDMGELLKFQELALKEYLAMVASRKR